MNTRSHLLTAALTFATLTFAAATASADELPAPPASTASDASPVKLYAGTALVATGGLAVLGGGISYFALSATTDAQGADEYQGAKTASILSMVLGGAGLAAGLPLVLMSDSSDFAVENDKNSGQRNAASLAPTIRIGVGAGTATWSF